MLLNHYIYVSIEDPSVIELISDTRSYRPRAVEIQQNLAISGDILGEYEILDANVTLMSDPSFLLALTRAIRDIKLAESDGLWIAAFTQGYNDARVAIEAYKEILRNIPNTTNFEGRTRNDIAGLFPAKPTIQ